MTVTLSIEGDILTISATGDTEYVDGYIVDIFDGDALKKSYTTDYELFDLSVAKGELPEGTYTVKARAYSDDGREFEESAGVSWVCTVPLPACEPMTLRFKFSKADYAPVDPDTGTSVTTKGTWRKVDTGDDNIWDWTYDDPDWSNAFLNVFTDENNLVDVIDAGDTASVTNCKSLFCVGGDNTSYVRSCCLFNTIGVTNMRSMFGNCKLLESVPLFNTSNVTTMRNMFNNCSVLKIVPCFNTSKVTDMCQMFPGCFALEEVPLFDTSHVTDMSAMFHSCASLTSVPLFDTRRVTAFDAMLNNCTSLTAIPAFNTSSATSITYLAALSTNITAVPLLDTHNVTNFKFAFNGIANLASVPKLDYGKATDISSLIGATDEPYHPVNLETLPDISTLTSALTACDNAFKNIRNAKYGISEAYEILKSCNPTTYTNCFLNCGINTEEGRAQLYQIPQDWGGLKPNISITFKFHDNSYNPAEHQLGVGKAVTGEDKYNQKNKNFSAEWVCLNSSENIWLWCVTEGTNLSSAFVYGDGTGVGVPMLSGEDYITGIPEELTLVEGGTRESLMRNAEDWKYGTIDQEDWVPEFEIIDWDLENATDITSFIGTNVWYKNNLVGTLPALRSSSISNIGYAFDRCWNVTAMGPINLPNCHQGANNAFMSMMGLEEIPEIEAYHSTSQLNNTFNGCLHASKSSIENAYGVLYRGTPSGTHNCFKKCGIEEDQDALENIPVSWGGNATIVGTNVNGNITPLAVGGKILRF